MFEIIKEKIWTLLKEKEISLAMIYDEKGKILWHRGREIEGKDVYSGRGFCKSYIQESLKDPGTIDVEDYISSDADTLSASARGLLVKSIIIHPIGRWFYLYIDSGKKEFFSEKDRISFKILGELLEQVIMQVREEANISGLTGSSRAIEGIRDLLVKFAMEEDPVLLTGETGVGKNHIAGLIHRFSGRKGKFVIVDTPNIDVNLFESKLFGHKKGAFTDARFDKTGLVEEAVRGTLFFDEITEVPPDIQAKLLRFIDTKKFYVLGESTEREADVRIIAASNKDLHRAVADKEFRQDLYYRLNVLEIEIPPLRLRKEDIKNLVLRNQELLRGKEMGEGFWEAFSDYDWPGNVRELLNILKRAGIMLDSPLTGEKIWTMLSGGKRDMPDKRDGSDGLLRETRERLGAGENFWGVVWKPFIARDIDRGAVRGILREFYLESGNSFKEMIKRLNVEEGDYQKFMSYIYKYNIDPRKG
jgi:transcriptional regulator with AAA-type ATPase domain